MSFHEECLYDQPIFKRKIPSRLFTFLRTTLYSNVWVRQQITLRVAHRNSQKVSVGKLRFLPHLHNKTRFCFLSYFILEVHVFNAFRSGEKRFENGSSNLYVHIKTINEGRRYCKRRLEGYYLSMPWS
jgi:hypothetical protein